MSLFGVSGRSKIEEFRISSCFCVRRALWIVLRHTLGSILESCWCHLELIVRVLGALMFAVSIGRLCFLSENVEENEKGEGKGVRERDVRQSVPLSACFGNKECVSEAKRIGSFLLVLLACLLACLLVCLLSFACLCWRTCFACFGCSACSS